MCLELSVMEKNNRLVIVSIVLIAGMSNGSNTNSCMAHAFYSGIYLYGLTSDHRYDTGTHMGLPTLSKNIRQLALFLSLHHIRIGQDAAQTRQL